MKKFIVLSLITVLYYSDTVGQIQQGNIMVGADIANVQVSLNKGGNFSLRIDPKAAWFVNDNIALGAYVNFEFTTAKGNGSSINYGIGPLARYYVSDKTLNVLNHSRFFVEANVGVNGYNPTVGDNTNGLGLGIGPGIAYFVTPNIGLEALVKYNGIIGFGSAVSSNNINIGFGFQVYLPSAKLKNQMKNP